MRRLLPLCALALVACTSPDPGAPAGVAGAPTGAAGKPAPAGTPAAATPHPTASSPVTAANPSGKWVLGDGAEPAAGPIVACQVDQTLTLSYGEGRLQGSVDTCAGLCSQLESLDGTYTNGNAQLVGTFTGNLDPNGKPVVYLLHFNAATQHLVGTRNGLPVWAAPFMSSNGPECHPSPTPVPEPTLADGTIIPVTGPGD